MFLIIILIAYIVGYIIFFYKHYNLVYSINDIEPNIIQKGNEILERNLEGKKYNYYKSLENCVNINKEYINYILSKEKNFVKFMKSQLKGNMFLNILVMEKKYALNYLILI